MNRIERWIFKGILQKEVKRQHAITGIYSMIRSAVELEYYEDNIPTVDAFLREAFNCTQSQLEH